jgi:hypothetical protein
MLWGLKAKVYKDILTYKHSIEEEYSTVLYIKQSIYFNLMALY